MKKFSYLFLDHLVVTTFFLLILVLNFVPINVRAEGEDYNDGFGNIGVIEPSKDKEVIKGKSLVIVWNTVDPKIAKVIGKKKYVYFQLTLIKEQTACEDSSCGPAKYLVVNGKRYLRGGNSASYSYEVVNLPSSVDSGRYRLAVCYQSYAGQRLSKTLARTRCGVSSVFNITDQSANGASFPDSSSADQASDSSADYFYDQSSNFSSAINGACGVVDNGRPVEPPTGDLCSKGEVSSIDRTETRWTWTCEGSDGGSSDICAVNILPSVEYSSEQIPFLMDQLQIELTKYREANNSSYGLGGTDCNLFRRASYPQAMRDLLLKVKSYSGDTYATESDMHNGYAICVIKNPKYCIAASLPDSRTTSSYCIDSSGFAGVINQPISATGGTNACYNSNASLSSLCQQAGLSPVANKVTRGGNRSQLANLFSLWQTVWESLKTLIFR